MTAPVEISSPGTKIAMTTPIEVNKSGIALVMRFFLPEEYSRNDLPEPSDPRVKLVELPPSTVAVLQFSGSTSDPAVSTRTAELVEALRATGRSMAFTIHAWKADQNITTVRIGPAVAVDKARELKRMGWEVYVTDAAGSQFTPQNFDQLLLTQETA